MAKLKGEFYTKSEATAAMDKINKYCVSVKVADYDYNAGRTVLGGGMGDDSLGRKEYDDFVSRYSFETASYMSGFPMTGGLMPGAFMADWAVSPYNYSNDMYGSYDVPVPKAILEAEVQDGQYSFVKERLYSCGAVSVY